MRTFLIGVAGIGLALASAHALVETYGWWGVAPAFAVGWLLGGSIPDYLDD